MSVKKDLLFLLFLVLYFALQFNTLLFQMPNGIHEWAQGDRLALAYGFYDNGMDFFKPSTLSQFSENGITGVEFPLQAYLAAAIAKLFGKVYLSLIFRLLDTFIIGICLFVLYKIASSFTKNFFIAVIPAIIPLLSPSFLNYTCNYMPDTVSVSILFIGMALYFQGWFQGKSNKRLLALFLCTLATLIKLSSGIYLVGFVVFDLFRFLKRKNVTISRNKLIAYFVCIVVCFALILGSVLYSKYLNETYSSTLFLMNVRPISWGDFRYLIGTRFPEVWLKEYFVVPAYGFIVGLFIIVFRVKRSDSKVAIVFLSLILFVGIAIVFYLMGAQFIDHDYYFIPIFMPFVAILALVVVVLYKDSLQQAVVDTGLPVVILGLLVFSYFKTQNRLSPKYAGFSDYYNTAWMKDGVKVLEENHIAKSEKIVALNENPPNLALVYFDRKGYALNKDHWGENFESLQHFFSERNVKYGVVKLSEFETLSFANPSFYNYFKILYKDNKMVLFSKL